MPKVSVKPYLRYPCLGVYPSLSPRDATLTRNRGRAAHLTRSRGGNAFLLWSLPPRATPLGYNRGPGISAHLFSCRGLPAIRFTQYSIQVLLTHLAHTNKMLIFKKCRFHAILCKSHAIKLKSFQFLSILIQLYNTFCQLPAVAW